MPNDTHTGFLGRSVRNKDGNVVIWQFPNIPLASWILFSILGLLTKHIKVHTGFHDLAQASLFTWAFLELRTGDSLFRRFLGGLVLLGLIFGFFITNL